MISLLLFNDLFCFVQVVTNSDSQISEGIATFAMFPSKINPGVDLKKNLLLLKFKEFR